MSQHRDNQEQPAAASHAATHTASKGDAYSKEDIERFLQTNLEIENNRHHIAMVQGRHGRIQSGVGFVARQSQLNA